MVGLPDGRRHARNALGVRSRCVAIIVNVYHDSFPAYSSATKKVKTVVQESVVIARKSTLRNAVSLSPENDICK